ncbi:MAG: hypothetical protein HUU01_10335 [Saprospiraceae bacterium]|nr:hypothetical protein [Saprospiraceae bacterium]
MIEVTIDILQPVTENARIQLDGVTDVVFQNTGTTNVVIESWLTILPNSTFQLATPRPDMLIVSNLRVAFTGVGTNRLEIATLRPKGPAYSNYAHQNQS